MRVLVADDSPVIRAILRDTLGEAGYEVIDCEDGTSAWEALADGSCHLAVLDWMMPGMSGVEVCRKLSKQSAADWAYIIILTGMKSRDCFAEAFEAGASDYATKPIRKEELLARVAVGARIIDLQRKLTQSEKLESVGRLAAGIAHEINTPIQYLGDNARFLGEAFEAYRRVFARFEPMLQLARDHDVDAVVEAFRALSDQENLEFFEEEVPLAIEQSINGIQRIATIVGATRDLASPVPTQCATVDVNRAVEAAVLATESEWQPNADLKLELTRELPLATGNSAEIIQVFASLISNAALAIREAADSASQGTISICTLQRAEFVEACVTDTGCGIPAHVRDKIFDPFFTTRETGKGTGQGLTIAQHIVVTRWQGTLSFESQVGEGTSFFVRLPVATTTAKPENNTSTHADR